MKTLQLYSVESVDKLAWPSEDFEISASTPALSIVTDFKHHKPLVIDANVKAVDMPRIMKQARVKMKVVVDNEGKFLGIIGYNDLSEEAIMRKVNKGEPRDELTVRDFMHHRDTLKSFDYQELSHATVSDVMHTQKNSHQQHCLVIDHETHEIRGLISSTDVSRLLKRTVDIGSHLSFEDLFNDVFSSRIPVLRNS